MKFHWYSHCQLEFW